MNHCASCGKEVPEEVCSISRLPCPFCGATGRSFSCTLHETVTVTDSISWSQTRPAPNGSATLHDSGRVDLKLTGQPPRNEEDSLAVSDRLVRYLNIGGEHWSNPVPGVADVDAISTDRTNPAMRLSIQVVRASTDRNFWQTLGRDGAAEKIQDVAAASNELISTIRKKAGRYPAAQRSSLTLVLDAGRTPNHTFKEVHDLFAQTHRDECCSFGFSSVWIVGAMDELVNRLDE